MKDDTFSKTLDIALAALETLELRSLTWGFVDQSLSTVEVEATIEATLRAHKSTESTTTVLKALLDRALIRMVAEPGEESPRYRTRLAELTRLLSRLRQWFSGQTWQSAATLVSDFRIDVRERRYPRRNIKPQEAGVRINAARTLSTLQAEVWKALTEHDPNFVLAEFQVEATRRLLSSPAGTGTIVTAGTGSGKTRAFYLPALVAVAPQVRPSEWWTKAICLYPRQELLKDQLSEAYRLALHAAKPLEDDHRRPFVLGSLFSPTPQYPNEKWVRKAGWEERGTGYVCPFLRCPRCEGDMLWAKETLKRECEELVCAKNDCRTQTDLTTLRLTRHSVVKNPPDLLFTTTEMMNQRLSDLRWRRVFGIGQDSERRPLFVLLDEAHTYAGVSGAQVALLLRRWSALLKSRVRWAGLSATLPNAARFFADLTGVRPDQVVCVEPGSSDLISEGAEYNLILRSDPSSQTATLSTSIQAVMLLSRMLDTRSGGRSEGRFGSRAFVFTDDLDVTHRLFDNLLDAEAHDRWRRPNPRKQPLAALRATTQPGANEREPQGQLWQMAEELHGNLATRLRIARTTSRDPGVDADADVIVATSSLEVGFNDPHVGAVVQHKAPRSAASFLQRRGRAGRPRGMRPLTLVVLSDYGRDRVAFQSYEHLFDPTVEIQALPVRNLYVLRMQAVYATFEWIADQAPRGTAGWAWHVTNGPGVDGDKQSGLRKHFKDQLRKILRFDPSTLDGLRAHLKRALCVDPETLDTVLWQPPRPLLLDALPTLGRRLFREWRLASGDGLDLHKPGNPPHPLPDFIPASLFSDLNLPEVGVNVPLPGGSSKLENRPIVPALQQLPPGRVTRRFADEQGKVSHWFPLDLSVSHQRLSIDRYCPRREYVGDKDNMPIFRPWQIPLARVPPNVGDKSNAHWRWESDFRPLSEPIRVLLPSVAGLSLVAEVLEFHLHRFNSGLAVRRFAHEGEATLRVNGEERLMTFELINDRQERAAVGFAFEADAFLVSFRLPDPAALAELTLAPEQARWLRYQAFARHVEIDSGLPNTLNSFQREWLYQAILLTALIRAERAEITLQRALQALRDDEDPRAFAPAIDALVNATVSAWDDDDDDDDDSDSSAFTHAVLRPQRLHDGLIHAITEPGVLQTLIDIALCWTDPSADHWGQWLGEVARHTIAEAVYQACISAAPQNAAAEGLTVDIEATEQGHRAIVAETTLGGGGTVEALAEVFAADPRGFVRALETACAPSDQEVASEELRRVLSCLAEDPHLANALSRLREASDTQSRDQARREFFRQLAERGIPVSRTLSVSIATRLLKPGIHPHTDALCVDLLREWQRLEDKYGIALPVRLATTVVAEKQSLRRRLAELGGAGQEILTAAILLWPSGGELRRRALQSYNPFRALPVVDAALARKLLFEARLPVVTIDEPDWLLRLKRELAAQGVVRLTTGRGDHSWRGEIARLLSEPITSGFLQFYPTIEATRVLEGGQLAIDLVLRDRV